MLHCQNYEEERQHLIQSLDKIKEKLDLIDLFWNNSKRKKNQIMYFVILNWHSWVTFWYTPVGGGNAPVSLFANRHTNINEEEEETNMADGELMFAVVLLFCDFGCSSASVAPDSGSVVRFSAQLKLRCSFLLVGELTNRKRRGNVMLS